jgi:hypothetical protein
MGASKAEMWGRAGREILRAYQIAGNPLRELARFASPAPTIHIYSQPRDDRYLAAQQEFASIHPWFKVRRIDATMHFPTLEEPQTVAHKICDFSRVSEHWSASLIWARSSVILTEGPFRPVALPGKGF